MPYTADIRVLGHIGPCEFYWIPWETAENKAFLRAYPLPATPWYRKVLWVNVDWPVYKTDVKAVELVVLGVAVGVVF